MLELDPISHKAVNPGAPSTSTARAREHAGDGLESGDAGLGRGAALACGMSTPTQDGQSNRPPSSDWNAEPPFRDLKLSHLVQIALTAALIFVGWLQFRVYQQQAEILTNQTVVTESLQRAFIGVSELKSEANDAGVQRITPSIRNSGQSPALDVAIAAANPHDAWISVPRNLQTKRYLYASWKVGAPYDPDLIFASNRSSALAHLTIGPGASTSASFLSDRLAKDDGMKAQSDQIGRFVFGSIHYTDIFSKVHVSKYCFRIDGATYGATGIENLQNVCSHWNCSDEYCDADKKAYDEEFDAAYAKAGQ